MSLKYFVPLFFAVFSLGIFVTNRSWNGQVYVYVGEQRAPAAVRTMSDYSSLERGALYRSVHSQLMAHAEVIRKEGLFGVQLGAPLVNRKGGGKEFGCQVQDHSGLYNRMQLEFTGVGVSEGGELAKLRVESICHSQLDLNKLETVWIPMNKIRASRAKDQMFETEAGGAVNVHLEDVPDQWPESWVLTGVKFYQDSNPDESLSISAAQLREAAPKLLSLSTAF